MANPLHQIPREKQRTLAWGLQSFKTDWTPEKKFGVMMLSKQIMALTKKGGHFVGADLRVRPSEEGAHTGAPLRHFSGAGGVPIVQAVQWFGRLTMTGPISAHPLTGQSTILS